VLVDTHTQLSRPSFQIGLPAGESHIDSASVIEGIVDIRHLLDLQELRTGEKSLRLKVAWRFQGIESNIQTEPIVGELVLKLPKMPEAQWKSCYD
jgi:hypothetical protein